MPKNIANGFTLIELLVVISIIGLLSSIVLAGLTNARAKSRDTKRVLDLKQLELALELHYDKYGYYTQPENLTADCSTGTGATCPTGTNWDPASDLRDLLIDGYISVLPVDPINNASYRYTYEPMNVNEPTVGKPIGQGFDLCAPLERGGTYCIQQRK